MSIETEIERMVVRLIGDGTSYRKMLQDAITLTNTAAASISTSLKKIEQAEISLNRVGNTLKTTGANMMQTGRTMSLYVTAPLTAAGLAAIKTGSDFEAGFARVQRTVDMTVPQLNNLKLELQNLASNQVPIQIEKLLGTAEIAGQLGIAKENIASFTKTIAMLDKTTNLTSEQGASQMAKFANITRMSQKDFDRLASTIVALGQAGASTESEIMAMSMRIAAAGTTIGMTIPQITGFANILSSLGLEPELGGTGISRLFLEMGKAVAMGGDELQTFAAISHKTTEQFSSDFHNNAQKAVTDFLEEFSKLSGDDKIRGLDAIGVGGVRFIDVMTRASNAIDKVKASINTADKAFAENKALARAAAIVFNTFAAEAEYARTAVKRMVTDAFYLFKGELTAIVRMVKEVADWFRNLDSDTKKTVIVFTALVAAVGPLLIGFGAFVFLTGQAVIGLTKLVVGTRIVTTWMASHTLAIVRATTANAAYAASQMLVANSTKAVATASVAAQASNAFWPPATSTHAVLGSAASTAWAAKDAAAMVAAEAAKKQAIAAGSSAAYTAMAANNAYAASMATTTAAIGATTKASILLKGSLYALAVYTGYEFGKMMLGALPYLTGLSDALAREAELEEKRLVALHKTLSKSGVTLFGSGAGRGSTGATGSSRGASTSLKLDRIKDAADLAEYTAKLREEIEAMGLSEDAAKRLAFAKKGLSVSEVDALISAKEAKAHEVEIAKSVKDLNKEVYTQYVTWGLNGAALELMKLRLEGATEAELKYAKAVMAVNEARDLEIAKMVEANEEQSRLVEKGMEMIKKLRTPAKVFEDSMVEINELFKEGAIDAITYKAAVADAKKTLDEANKAIDKKHEFKFDVKGIEAVGAGTTAAIARVQEYAAMIEQLGLKSSTAQNQALIMDTRKRAIAGRDALANRVKAQAVKGVPTIVPANRNIPAVGGNEQTQTNNKLDTLIELMRKQVEQPVISVSETRLT